MPTEPGAVRHVEKTYQCRCVMNGSRCHRDVSPDHPFCSDCDSRHPDMVNITAVPIGQD